MTWLKKLEEKDGKGTIKSGNEVGGQTFQNGYIIGRYLCFLNSHQNFGSDIIKQVRYTLRHVNIKKAETKQVWLFNIPKTGLFKDFAPQIGLSENRKTFFHLILLSSTEKNKPLNTGLLCDWRCAVNSMVKRAASASFHSWLPRYNDANCILYRLLSPGCPVVYRTQGTRTNRLWPEISNLRVQMKASSILISKCCVLLQ